VLLLAWRTGIRPTGAKVATVLVIEDERHIADVVRIAVLDEPVDLAVTAAERHQGRGEVGLPDAQGTPVDAPQQQRA